MSGGASKTGDESFRPDSTGRDDKFRESESSESADRLTRRSLLLKSGLSGAILLSGDVTATSDTLESSVSESSNRFRQSVDCEEYRQSLSCREERERLLKELREAKAKYDNCMRRKADIEEQNRRLQENLVGEFGVRHDCFTPEECGYLAVPSCAGEYAIYELQRRLLARLLEECQDVPRNVKSRREINRALRHLYGELNRLEEQLIDLDYEIDALTREIEQTNKLSIGGFSIGAGAARTVLRPPNGSRWENAWDTREAKYAQRKELEKMIKRTRNQISQLEQQRACLSGDRVIEPQDDLKYNQKIDAGKRAIRRLSLQSETTTAIQDQPTVDVVDVQSYAYDEARTFEPWELDFEPPTNDAEAVFQDFVRNSLYQVFVDYDLAVSYSRYATAFDTRVTYENMQYVPRFEILPFVEAELKQMSAIIYNAEASVALLEEAIEMRPEVNAAWEQAGDDLSNLSPDEVKQRIRESWSDEPYRDELLRTYQLTPLQWDVYVGWTDDAVAALNDIDIENSTPTEYLDDEWEALMRDLAAGNRAVANSFRESRSTLRELWLGSSRVAG